MSLFTPEADVFGAAELFDALASDSRRVANYSGFVKHVAPKGVKGHSKSQKKRGSFTVYARYFDARGRREQTVAAFATSQAGRLQESEASVIVKRVVAGLIVAVDRHALETVDGPAWRKRKKSRQAKRMTLSTIASAAGSRNSYALEILSFASAVTYRVRLNIPVEFHRNLVEVFNGRAFISRGLKLESSCSGIFRVTFGNWDIRKLRICRVRGSKGHVFFFSHGKSQVWGIKFKTIKGEHHCDGRKSKPFLESFSGIIYSFRI